MSRGRALDPQSGGVPPPPETTAIPSIWSASIHRRFFPAVMLVPLLLVAALHAAPVEFVFKLEASPLDPFARELWADVATPSGRTLRLPVFFTGDDRFAVRARPDAAGTYRLAAIIDATGEGPPRRLAPELVTAGALEVASPSRLAAVGLDPRDPRRFALADGQPFTPLGANLAWSEGNDRLGFYREALPAFARAGLNWTRVWMAHWGGLNLEWLPDDMLTPVPHGALDLRVAGSWDELLRIAEDAGVHVQIVLQHHGQFSTTVNSNWAENPWNAKQRGGFLKAPGEFFTSPEAKRLTKLKYRYIVARWGWSPAVMGWELFNEVHWTDAMSADRNEAAVAAWHAEMAAFLRSLDAYGHLVTTSTENLRSPIYAAMDFYQPHLYATNILAGARFVDPPPAQLDRPVFYGEFGDDHLPLGQEDKVSGAALVPPVWASLMSAGAYPAQPWLGAQLLATGRLGELEAVSRFLKATQLLSRADAVPFTPVVACDTRVPLVLSGAQVWQRRTARTITVPTDGREPAELAELPRIYVGSPSSLAEGFPNRTTLEFNPPQATSVRLRFTDAGAGGARARVSLDGALIAEHVWPALPTPPEANASPPPPRPTEVAIDVPAGAHTLTLENAGGPDWFALREIDLGLDTPALAAVGRRSADFVALWLWQRQRIFEVQPPAPVAGTLLLDDAPAGDWRVTWWDTQQGIPSATVTLHHPGGRLSLPIPPVLRHAAVVLER
ncbi:MAG TPA: hypothetical protein VGD81_14900 [Opitutaceae bacterium]